MDETSNKSETEIVDEKNQKGSNFMNHVQFAVMCVVLATQNVLVTGGITASMTAAEKAYKVTSLHISFCFTVYNIFFTLTSIPLGYFAKGNKMKYITPFMLLISIGGLIAIIPVFFVDPPLSASQSTAFLCTTVAKTSKSIENSQTKSLVFMYIGYALIGIGSCPLYNLGYNQIYEMFDKSVVSIYVATYMMFTILGTSFTFILAGFVLKIFFHPWKSKGLSITPLSENWIGAYWIFYLYGSSMIFILFCVNLLILKFGKIKTHSEENKSELSFKDFKLYLLRCFKNIPLILIIAFHVFCYLMKNSLSNFFLKYLEVQFQIPAQKASQVGGMSLILGMISGFYVSSFLSKKIITTKFKILIFSFITAIISFVALLAAMFYCEISTIDGLTKTDVNVESFSTRITKSCHCNMKEFFPVCYNNITSYYSPCQLGCETMSGDAGEKVFTQCDSKFSNTNDKIFQGRCKKECKKLFPYIWISVVCVFFGAMIEVPTLNIIRAYADKDLSNFAISLHSFFLRIFLVIGPVIYGKLFESACILKRQTKNISEISNCIEYDQKILSQRILGFSAFLQAIYVVGIAISLIWEFNANKKTEMKN